MSGSPSRDRVAQLQEITAPDRMRVNTDDLLEELLDQVRRALEADTAAVLLRDPGSDYLVARAARGLEEEVRQGVRIRLGRGFAGTIAARREPVRLERVDATTVANPILWEKGIKAMLGVPLDDGGDLLGVMHVGRLERRPFTEDDVDVLQIAGQKVAAALVAHRLALGTAAANLLERGLQPTRLPSLPGIEFSARYVPAEGRAVGGDWYDAFVLPDGELWLVVGDVAGHGLDAAVVMGRVKSALRSYALLGEPPERVLELTDRKVAHFEMGVMVTVACATTRPPYDRLRICVAGHPPPVLATEEVGGELVDAPVGPPLGVVPGAQRAAIDVPWPAGGVVMFYTDGLVERRDSDLWEAMLALATIVPAADPDTACSVVMHEMVGHNEVADDVAVLAVRRSPDTSATDDAD